MVRVTSHPCLLTPGELKPESPLFVFLPGMDGTGQLLRSQTQSLTQAFDVRCLAIPADDLNNWDDLTDEVIHLIEAELSDRPSRSVYLCGESFGGCLALKVALRASHLFDRIILSNPATSFRQQPWFLWGSPLISWLPNGFYSLSALAFLPFLASLDKLNPIDRRALLDAMRSVPAKTANWRLSMLREFDVDEGQLESLTQPVLVIASAADRLWSSLPEANYLVECLPDAKVLVLPHSGHACLLEAEVNLFEILNNHDFLDSSVFSRATESSSTKIIGV